MALMVDDGTNAAHSGASARDASADGRPDASRFARRLSPARRRAGWTLAALAVTTVIAAMASLLHARRTAAELGACVPPFGVEHNGPWENENAGDGPLWALGGADAAGGHARVDDVGTRRYEATLLSPGFTVPAHGADLEFRQRRAYSWANTMGVLEIALDGGSFVDVTTAGGTFTKGGYDSRSLPGNPLGFRAAWAAAPNEDTLTRITLPRSTYGKTARLRFRLGSAGTGDVLPGWSLDDIRCTVGE
jgi:hypothetical protein